MGAELFEARPELLIESADRVLGWSLRDVCLNGPIETLTRTDRAQPALFALSFALWDLFIDKFGDLPMCAAGHSLGEYTAFGAAGAYSFESGLRLVAARGSAMASAAGLTHSGMAALLGPDEEHVEQIVSDRRSAGGQLWVANLNAPGQFVVAGAMEDIDWMVSNGRDVGVRRVVKLNVAGAFHSPLMEPAVEAVTQALAATDFADLRFGVWANVTGDRTSSNEAPTLLARQVVSPVRFSASLASMQAAGIDTFVHVGPGDVTAGMAKRAARGVETVVVNTIESIDSALDVLGGR